MKNLTSYIKEGLLNRKISTRAPIRYKPETKEELQYIIIDLLNKGITDLNCIDVSKITDMSHLFKLVNKTITVKNIDISEWDVSNVTSMEGMFTYCRNFNSDLSKWNVSNVKDTRFMLEGCVRFNSDLSKWNVSNVQYMYHMFFDCKEFNADLSNWDISNVTNMIGMFIRCTKVIKNNKIPDWYKSFV